MTKSEQAVVQVINAALAAGFEPAGETRIEIVRIPTQRSPVFGGIGGERRQLGGRLRFAKPGTDVRITIGPRTTNVYRVIDGRTEFLDQFRTNEIDPENFTQKLIEWSTTPVKTKKLKARLLR